MEVMQSNNKHCARLNSRRRRWKKSALTVVVFARVSWRLDKPNPQHLLGSRRHTVCTSSQASTATSGLAVALTAAPFKLNAGSVFKFGPFNLNAHTRMLNFVAVSNHARLPTLHRGAA